MYHEFSIKYYACAENNVKYCSFDKSDTDSLSTDQRYRSEFLWIQFSVVVIVAMLQFIVLNHTLFYVYVPF